MRRILALLVLLAWTICASVAAAGEASVAVAANFTAPMQKIAAAFEADTGHKARVAYGSTGAFYAQIRNGAPFDVLISADDETPARIEKEGLAAAGTRFTYGTGRLALWSAMAGLVDGQGEFLLKGSFDRIAVANPKLAPYGIAAIETLTSLKQLERLQPRIVQGENIAQTYQFVSTGNAAVGFIALSQVMVDGRIAHGSAWIVPENLHAPLKQDAVVLARGKDNAAAIALAAYLRTDRARAIIRSYGYMP